MELKFIWLNKINILWQFLSLKILNKVTVTPAQLPLTPAKIFVFAVSF